MQLLGVDCGRQVDSTLKPKRNIAILFFFFFFPSLFSLLFSLQNTTLISEYRVHIQRSNETWMSLKCVGLVWLATRIDLATPFSTVGLPLFLRYVIITTGRQNVYHR